MRQILSLLFLMAIFTGCKDQNVNVQKSGGIWHLNDGVFNADGTSKKAVIGSEKDLATEDSPDRLKISSGLKVEIVSLSSSIFVTSS